MKTRSDKRAPFPHDPQRVEVCLRQVARSGECWLWTGKLDRRGYGVYQQNGQPSWRAHRAVWTVLVGPLDAALELDHLCRNPRCVRPSHLEPVTHAENMRRAGLARTHCAQGHPYTEANTHRRKNGHRSCLACARERMRAKRLMRDDVPAVAPTGDAA